MTKQIPLTHGKVALVDDAMYDYLMQWKWLATRRKNRWYAARYDRSKGKKRTVLMHRVVMNNPKTKIVDHKNNDETLNNQRENLRVCTHSQNAMNSGARSTNTTGYKGVTWSKTARKFMAQIVVNKKFKNLGYFLNPVDAAHAYDEAANKHHGDFARTNFGQ